MNLPGQRPIGLRPSCSAVAVAKRATEARAPTAQTHLRDAIASLEAAGNIPLTGLVLNYHDATRHLAEALYHATLAHGYGSPA